MVDHPVVTMLGHMPQKPPTPRRGLCIKCGSAFPVHRPPGCKGEHTHVFGQSFMTPAPSFDEDPPPNRRTAGVAAPSVHNVVNRSEVQTMGDRKSTGST